MVARVKEEGQKKRIWCGWNERTTSSKGTKKSVFAKEGRGGGEGEGKTSVHIRVYSYISVCIVSVCVWIDREK